MKTFRDTLERFVSTYVVTFIGLALAGGAFTAAGVVHVSVLEQAGLAAIPAALSIPINLIRNALARPPRTGAGDVLLRTVLTWSETFGGLLLASNVFSISAAQPMKVIVAMGVSSIPAALTFLKANAAQLFGNPASGSLDPTVGPEPLIAPRAPVTG